MRKKGSGSSAAYYIETKNTELGEVKTYALPRIGSLIVMNEMNFDSGQGNHKGVRGCYLVVGQTSSCLQMTEMYSPECQHSTSFLKKDIVRGYYRYVEVDEPVYRYETSWVEYELDVSETGT